MFHEIIFALLGHTGSIFVEYVKPMNIDEMDFDDQEVIKFCVNPTITFLSVAEIE